MFIEEQIENNYAFFKQMIEKYVHCDGVADLLVYLDTTNLKNAPASTKYNLACDGGFVQHAFNVLSRLQTLCASDDPFMSEEEDAKESMVLVALLSDIGKVDCYKKYAKNVRNNETGKWESETAYAFEDNLALGSNEENSIFILSKFIHLTNEEIRAILYSNGIVNSDSFAQGRMYDACKKSPLASYLTVAKFLATTIDEAE